MKNTRPPTPAESATIVTIDYTNWRGERNRRRITPVGIYWGKTDWHPKPQWLLIAIDEDTRKERHFAIAMIHAWE